MARACGSVGRTHRGTAWSADGVQSGKRVDREPTFGLPATQRSAQHSRPAPSHHGSCSSHNRGKAPVRVDVLALNGHGWSSRHGPAPAGQRRLSRLPALGGRGAGGAFLVADGDVTPGPGPRPDADTVATRLFGDWEAGTLGSENGPCERSAQSPGSRRSSHSRKAHP